MKNSKTAFLFFANSAKYEASRKSFYKSVRFFKELNATIKKKVKQSKILSCFIFINNHFWINLSAIEISTSHR